MIFPLSGNDKRWTRSLRTLDDSLNRTRSCSPTCHCTCPSLSRVFVAPTRFFSPESYYKADIDPPTGKPLDVGISDLEPKGSAKGNAGFFEKGLMSALESSHRARGIHREVTYGLRQRPLKRVILCSYQRVNELGRDSCGPSTVIREKISTLQVLQSAL